MRRPRYYHQTENNNDNYTMNDLITLHMEYLIEVIKNNNENAYFITDEDGNFINVNN